MLSASLIQGTGRSQRLIPPPAEEIAHTPFATGEKGLIRQNNPPSRLSIVGEAAGAVKSRGAAHPMDAPPRVRIEKKSIT